MTLTNIEKQALVTALRAETDPSVVTALAVRDDAALQRWCNAESATDAWLDIVTSKTIVEAIDITKFDALTAGKRDSWAYFTQWAPYDLRKAANRKVAVDVWGNTDSIPVLQALRRKATHAEIYLGGSTVTTNTVSGWKANWIGTVGLQELSEALNVF